MLSGTTWEENGKYTEATLKLLPSKCPTLILPHSGSNCTEMHRISPRQDQELSGHLILVPVLMGLLLGLQCI